MSLIYPGTLPDSADGVVRSRASERSAQPLRLLSRVTREALPRSFLLGGPGMHYTHECPREKKTEESSSSSSKLPTGFLLLFFPTREKESTYKYSEESYKSSVGSAGATPSLAALPSLQAQAPLLLSQYGRFIMACRARTRGSLRITAAALRRLLSADKDRATERGPYILRPRSPTTPTL